MKFFLRLIAIILFILPLQSFASTPAQQLINKLSSIHTMKANFQQTLYGEQDKVLQRSFGSVTIQRPGKFRWQIKKPNRQLLITDGKNLWIYDHDLAQVIVEKIKNGIGNTPASLLSGSSKNVLDYFHVGFKNDWFVLTPKNKNNIFQRVQLYFQKNKLLKMELIDNLGQKSVLRFSSIMMNKKLNLRTFVFRPPKGVDVINQGQTAIQ